MAAAAASPAKGTVIPVAAAFSPAEASAAASRVESAAASRRAELEKLRSFAADNSVLVHLVCGLPDQLSHQIMVPFGGAAFFPGRLIHTNEFLVLLGEGYYAERTAKQTAEILQRRGKALDAQIESLSAVIADLELEAKFFKSTASEASEGLIEIVEEYVESPEKVLESGFARSSKDNETMLSNKKEEDDKLLARFDELVKQEEEEESDYGDEDEAIIESESSDKTEEEEGSTNGDDDYYNGSWEYLPSSFSNQGHEVEGILNSEGQFPLKAISLKEIEKPGVSQPLTLLHSVPQNLSLPKEDRAESSSGQPFKTIISSGQKAFTGSVVERADNLPAYPPSRNTIPERNSSAKPVSKFKMGRVG